MIIAMKLLFDDYLFKFFLKFNFRNCIDQSYWNKCLKCGSSCHKIELLLLSYLSTVQNERSAANHEPGLRCDGNIGKVSVWKSNPVLKKGDFFGALRPHL